MKNLIDKTIKSFLVIAGLCTSSAGLSVFLPRFAVENVLKLLFIEDYTIIVQHWGMMILGVGVFHDHSHIQNFMAYAYPDLQRL